MSKLNKEQWFIMGFIIGGISMFICFLPIIKDTI